MKFTPGIEEEDSFMIIPNEFVKDHELTQEEAEALMTPDPEYERTMTARYPHPRKFSQRIKRLFACDAVRSIITLKSIWNKLRRRKLHSRYDKLW